jgi:histidinol dehydrogenase
MTNKRGSAFLLRTTTVEESQNRMKLIRTFGRTASAAEALIQSLEQRGSVSTASVEPTVRAILANVKKRGDKALIDYATKFDGLAKNQPLRVPPEEMQAAWNSITPALQLAMQTAQANIRAFAEAQLAEEWTLSTSEGVTTGQIVRPLASVGCYVPGGRYPLPSTLLMTTTPAQVAGVERIVVCSPNPAKETLAAAHLAGVTEFYRIGGAQAIAALAYGTASIAPVNKIVGPGNLYVTAAKIAVSNVCGIDMPAGPTEIVVTSERLAPEAIAADLVAQAEHDPETLAVFITTNEALAKAVSAEVKRQSKSNPLAKQSIAARGCVFVTNSVTEARALTNRLAPEHLTVDTLADLAWVQNAGSVFVGAFAPQAMGDYVSGPNHVLPTGRNGRIRGGLSVMDFVKVITVQQYTRKGLRALGPHAAAIADAEGLTGHAASVGTRMQ